MLWNGLTRIRVHRSFATFRHLKDAATSRQYLEAATCSLVYLAALCNFGLHNLYNAGREHTSLIMATSPMMATTCICVTYTMMIITFYHQHHRHYSMQDNIQFNLWSVLPKENWGFPWFSSLWCIWETVWENLWPPYNGDLSRTIDILFVAIVVASLHVYIITTWLLHTWFTWQLPMVRN